MCLIPSLEILPRAWNKVRIQTRTPGTGFSVSQSRHTEWAWIMEHEHKQLWEVSWIQWCPAPLKRCLHPNSRDLRILPGLEKGSLLRWLSEGWIKRWRDYPGLSRGVLSAKETQQTPTASSSWGLSPRASGGVADLLTSWFWTPASRTVRE